MNPIDDAGFDEILKQNNITAPHPSGIDPWADMGLPEQKYDNSFMGSLMGKGIPDEGIDKISGGASDSNIVQHPWEFTKGLAKGVPQMGVDLLKVGQAVQPYTPGGVANSILGIPQPKTDFTDVDEMLAPSNPPQEVGKFAAGFLPAERAVTASKPLIEGAIDATKTLTKPVGEYMAKRGEEKTTNFIKDLITPELTPTKTTNAIKTGKVIEGGVLKDRDITGAVPFFESMSKAVAEVPGISKSKTLLDNANHIHDHIGTVADDLVSQLKTSAKEMKISNLEQVPAKFNEYMKGVKATLKENPTLVGDAEKTATKILNKFESLVKEEGSTPYAILSARKKLDAWMSSQKGDNVFDPKTEGAVSVALRAIRQGGNDFVSKLSTDVKVKDMLAKQTSLYDAIENIAPKAAKEGANGFKRWIKSHPKLVEAAKYTAGLGVGAGTVGVIVK